LHFTLDPAISNVGNRTDRRSEPLYFSVPQVLDIEAAVTVNRNSFSDGRLSRIRRLDASGAVHSIVDYMDCARFDKEQGEPS
jgi:hypothetical protein